MGIRSEDFGSEVTYSSELFDQLRQILNINGEINEFIGSHPVSLERTHVEVLLNEDYLVCEKSDGIRIMMFIINHNLFLYDRKNKFFRTEILTQFEGIFLFDGELFEESGQYIYAIFDTLIYKNLCVTELNLLERLKKASDFCKPQVLSLFLKHNSPTLKTFGIIFKHMTKSYGLKEVLESIPNLKHENDGLIFTPVYRPYVLRERSSIFKWKPPHLNTIDFYIKPTKAPYFYDLCCTVTDYQLKLYTGRVSTNKYVKFAQYFSEVEPKIISNKIGEFCFKLNSYSVNLNTLEVFNGAWAIHKIRTDKTSPNNFSVVLNVIGTIDQSLTDKDLTLYLPLMAKNYKARQEKYKQI